MKEVINFESSAHEEIVQNTKYFVDFLDDLINKDKEHAFTFATLALHLAIQAALVRVLKSFGDDLVFNNYRSRSRSRHIHDFLQLVTTTRKLARKDKLKGISGNTEVARKMQELNKLRNKLTHFHPGNTAISTIEIIKFLFPFCVDWLESLAKLDHVLSDEENKEFNLYLEKFRKLVVD